MLEKLVYFISSFSLLFWTVFSNKKSLDESLAYVWVVTILLAVELVISIIWEKNRKKRQGIYIMLFLMNIGAAVSYCASVKESGLSGYAFCTFGINRRAVL